jgi:neutral ceramidase
MDSFQDVKAGPSETRSQWTRQPTISQRLFKALAIVIIISLGCFAFAQLFLNQQKLFRFWEKGSNRNGNEWHHDSSKKTQYLLGVGKADITGYGVFEVVSPENLY